MTIATVMVYVDPAQQAEGQVRVARSIAEKFDASLIGVSAFAVEPNFVAEGVIIEETAPEDIKRMKTGMAMGRRISNHVLGERSEIGRSRCNSANAGQDKSVSLP